MTVYITRGDVRGECGHEHRTESGAERCIAADQRGCASQGGYSDRYVIAVDDDGGETLLDDEADEFAAEQAAAEDEAEQRWAREQAVVSAPDEVSR